MANTLPGKNNSVTKDITVDKKKNTASLKSIHGIQRFHFSLNFLHFAVFPPFLIQFFFFFVCHTFNLKFFIFLHKIVPVGMKTQI